MTSLEGLPLNIDHQEQEPFSDFFNKIAAELGFVKNERIQHLEQEIISFQHRSTDIEELRELVSQFQSVAEETCQSQQSCVGIMFAQMALYEMRGDYELLGDELETLFLDEGNFEGLSEETIDKLWQTRETIDRLIQERAVDNELTGADISNACQEILSPEDCDELAQMSFEEALDFATSLFIENGVDEDIKELLKRKNIIR